MRAGNHLNGVPHSLARGGRNGSSKAFPFGRGLRAAPGRDEHPDLDWLLWQLIDSGFPTGGFAHSFGLEAAAQQGEVRGREDLGAYVEVSLDQLGHAMLPFVMAAFDGRPGLNEIDGLCDAFTTNHIGNRASRAQGRAFLSAVERVFAADLRPLNLEVADENSDPGLPFAHFAPVFGACLRRLGVPRKKTGRMFVFSHLRGLLAAAVRLGIVGPMEAQTLQHRLCPKAEAVLKSCERLTLEEIAQTAPLLDLWQGAQDRLYSRLFQS